MVIKGPISVQLVDATTKKPFKEYLGPCGRVYCEVEPNAEYFVALVPNPYLNQVVGCQIWIDGEKLGSGRVIMPNSLKIEIGSSRLEDGVETMTSFRFEKPNNNIQNNKNKDGGGSSSSCSSSCSADYSGMIMGSVTIRIHQLYFAGYVPYFEKRSNKITSSHPMNLRVNHPGMVTKLLRSGPGTVSQTSHWGKGYMQNYSKGPLLDEFTFHYCTTPGLILAGILKRRPSAALTDISNGYNRRPAEAMEVDMLSKVKHKRFKFDGVCSDGTRIKTKTTEYDLFDLTELEDD